MFYRTRFHVRVVMVALLAVALELFLFVSASLSQTQESTTANERLECGAQLTVRLLGGDGQPMSGIVCLRGEDGRETCSAADHLGTVAFFRLAPDAYVAIVFRGSQQLWADHITIADRFAVQSETIRIPASQAASSTISVKDFMIPERARSLYETGRKALFKGEYSNAQSSLQAALSICPSFPRARNALAIAYVKQYDFMSAIAQLEIAVSLDPQFGEAHFNYGIILTDTGRYADAAAHFAKALDLKFSPERVADNLISSDIYANQPDAALAALHTIHQRNLKHRATLHREVADYLDALGRGQDAKAQHLQYTSETQFGTPSLPVR